MHAIKSKYSQKEIPRQFLLFLSLMFIIVNIKAQSIAPQAITSAASNFSQSNGSLSFTVGELIVITATDSIGNSIGNGFIPGSVSGTQIVAIKEPDVAILNVKVYPNPTSDLLFVDFISAKTDWVMIDIIDTRGSLVFSEKYVGMANHIGINSAKWQSGSYILLLKDLQNKVIGKYHIIKNINH